MFRKDGRRQQKRANGEKDVNVWLRPNTINSLEILKKAYPDKNQTDIINEALQAWAERLSQDDGHEKEQQGPDKETRQRLKKLEHRIERLEAEELTRSIKEVFPKGPAGKTFTKSNIVSHAKAKKGKS